MPIAGSKRSSGVDLEEEREERATALKNTEPQAVPVVDVSGKGKSQGRVVSTGEPLAKEKQDKSSKRKEKSDQSGDVESSKKSRSTLVEGREVLDLESGDVRASQVGYRQLTLGETFPPKTPVSPTILFNEEFMKNCDAPGWGKQVREAMAVPPVPVLARDWGQPQRKIVGDCLAKRVAANIKVPPKLDVKTIASSALSEFGLSIHAVSTCLHSVIMGAQQAADREAKLAAEAETLKNTLADKDRMLKETSEKMAEELRKAKELHAAQQSEMQKLKEEVAEKSRAAEKAVKTAEDKVLAVEGSLKLAEEKVLTADERAAKAEGRVAEALEEYKDSGEFWDLLIESYDQGIFHMARCFRRAADQGTTPTMEDLAAYVLEDPFSAELVAYHPVNPFKSSEIDEHLAECRKKKRPKTVFPEILDRNLRVFVVELEAARKAKAKADAAARAKAKADAAAKKAAETDGADKV